MTAHLALRLVCLLFLLSGVAHATVFTRFINASTGNDAFNGLTPTTAYRTIQFAVNNPPSNIRNGDTLILDIATGFYNQNVVVPTGWPSQQLSCAVCPGGVKLVLKGPYVTYNGVRFVPTSPVTATNLRDPNVEAEIQQVSGAAGITIGEGVDIEILGLRIRNTNNQAIRYDGDDADQTYTCTVQFPDFVPADPTRRYPSRIRIRHNIIETVGTTFGNTADDGIVGIYNNVDRVTGGCQIQRAETFIEDNLVRNVVGNDLANRPLLSAGLVLKNVDGTVRIQGNAILGANANRAGLPTMTVGIRLFGVRGTRNNRAIVRKNLVSSTIQSGIQILSDDIVDASNNPIETLTSRWIDVVFNSLAGNNTSEGINFGGVEVNISSDRADLPNAEINVNNNVFNANNVSGLVYTGDTPFDLRNFRAIHNIFIGNRIGNSPAAGIRNNNVNPFAPQISRVDAGGNWWGDERGPNHLDVGGLPLASYNSAPGNQELRFENDIQELSVFYSPWLRGNGPNGTQSPDDLLDDATAPFDTASWGFNNSTPKTYIVKELLRSLFERDIQPEFHTLTPDMNPIPPVSGPGVEGYISKGVALSKDNDTLDVLAGTYQDLITVSKSLTIRGPQANVSASCNSMRDVNVANVNRINREAKIVKGRFLGNPTQNANQPGPLITILNKKATIEGLTFYVFQSQAISNAQERTSQEIIVRNNIIRTMNVPGNGNSVSGPGNIFTGGAFVTFENHNGPLTIEGNKFENIIGRFAYTEQFASSAAISLENCDRSTYVRNNYIEGDPTVIEYDPQSLAPIRLPLSYGVAVIGCRPTGADSLWIEGNYIYRSDNSAIFITDLGVPRRSVNNIVVRRNTIDQANLSTFHEGQNRVVFNNNLLPVPNTVEGGIAMYLSQTGSNNIHVSYNHIKNARNAAVFLRELPQNDPQYAPFNTPSNLKINYNLFHLEQPFTPTTLTVNAHPNFLQYTYANTAADAGLICGWRGTGSVDARANWWNADLGPEHGFNVATAPGRVRLIVEPFNTDKVHYSPWLAGISLPDDQEDRGPVWNPIIASANYYENFAGALTPGVRTNLNMDCASWGYQDNTRKSYYVRISSPGTAACQPQAAHNFAKAGDEVNLRDVRAFEFEDLFITKNLLLNAETDFVNINAKVRDIHVFNGSRVNLVTNFIARNINLSCPVNVNNSCINLGPRVANGFIETYANALFLKELEFEGTVCEQPTTVATEEDRYVRGILVARRRVGPAQANNFGNMGFFLGAGSDNLGNVTVKRIAGPDQSRTLLNPTNPDLSTVVSNNRRSVNRKWTITTENAYTPGSRNVQLFWYQREDNNNSVLLSRPWQWNANKNNAQWTGLQPATVSQIINPRLITVIGFLNDEPAANRRVLNDSLTIAENSCNIVAALGTPSSTTICEGQSVDFNLTITGGRAPYTIFVTENGSPLAPITVSGPGTNFTITITPSAIAAQDRIYRIVRINDVTGCSETANLGVQRDILVRPTPTAAISGMPAPVCIGELANFRVDFTGIGPWRFQYRVNPTGPIMEVTTNQNPFTLQVPGPNNSTLDDEMFTVELLSVDYGPNTCNGTVVGSGSVMGTVRPDPTATFVIAQNTSLEACSCAPVQLDVLLTGQGPWIVEYTIGTSRFTTSQLGSTNDPRNGVTRFFTIFPNVINPVQCPQGRFPVRLTRVIDANGCDNLPAGNVDVDIVWKETPNATFTTTTINVCEGTNPVNIPVRVQGDNPWTVRFTVNGVDRFQTIGIGAPSGSIVNLPVTGLLNGANSIIIRGVEDGDGCSNLNINSNAIVNVNPAPSIGFVGVDPEICVGGVGTLTVEVNGVGPWTFGHTQNGVPQPPITVGQFNQRGPAQFNIPVSPSATTIFALTSVTDGNIPVCAGQVIGNPRIVTVNPLPTASLITPPTTICEGQPVTLQAFVTGRGPWTIGYTANGQGQTPVIVGNSTDPSNGHIVSWTVRPTQTTTYALTTVSDGSSPASTCTNSALGVPTVVTVNPNPTAAFNSPSPVSVCQGNPLRLPIVLTGNGPWFVTYQISGFGPAQTKQISLGLPSQTTGEFVIEETLLGNSQISILSVTDRFGCTSNPSGIGSSVAVIVSAAPSAVLSGGQQIGCLGQPLNLQVTFTGTGPWDLVYRENNNPPQTVTGITTNPYTLVVTPTQLGSVTYRLESVSFSGQCTSTLVSGNATVQVNPLPTATLSTGNTTICSGQQTAIGIVFSGRGPWTVTYRENGGPELTQTLGNATQSGSTPLLWNVTPMMTTTYELVRVQDGNGCVAPAVGTVTITTINAPSVSFVQNSITQCLGQPSNLAVNLVGNGPWDVSFIEGVTPRTVRVGAVGNSGTPAAPFVANIVVNPVITTVYTLTGVTDNSATICPGTVSGGPLTVTVAQPPTANLSVVGGPISVCAGSPVTLLLSATGTITAANPLSVVISDGTTQQTVLMQNPSQQVTVNPTTAGTITYTIREISYNGNCLITAPSNSITGSATINVQAAPTASISGSPSNVCVGSNISFTVNLSGQPPLAFSYTIVGPSGTPRTFSVNNLQPGPFALTILPQEAGLNTISINSVTGGGTCPGVVLGNPVNFTVGQGPTATISSTGNPAAICLGAPSTLTVNLTGTAPWTITVQEDPAPTTTRTFTGITSSPFTFDVTPNATGTRQFRILSVQDAGGCAPVIGSGVATVNVGNASNITVIAVRNRDVSCNGGADGALTVTAFISPACAPGQCPLEYSLDGVNWQTSNQFTDLPVGTYVAQARIIGTFCAGSSAPVVIRQPSNVSNVRITNVTVNSANVSWAPYDGQGVVFYEVQYRVLGETTWTVASNSIVQNNFNLVGLQNNTTYEVRVRQRCNGSQFSPFVSTSFTTNPLPNCAIPGGIYFSNVMPGMATVNWNPVGQGVCYVVQYRDVANGNWLTEFTQGTSLTLTGLTACNYQVRIRTNCTECSNSSGIRSSFSNAFSLFVPNANCNRAEVAAAPAADLNFRVYPNPNNGTFSVSFNATSEAAANLQLFDLTGKVVFETSYTAVAGENIIPVELNNFAAGVYLLKFNQAGQTQTTKVVLN